MWGRNINWLSSCMHPNRWSYLQPEYVPWLGIKPTSTFLSVGQHSNQLSHTGQRYNISVLKLTFVSSSSGAAGPGRWQESTVTSGLQQSCQIMWCCHMNWWKHTINREVLWCPFTACLTQSTCRTGERCTLKKGKSDPLLRCPLWCPANHTARLLSITLLRSLSFWVFPIDFWDTYKKAHWVI